MVCQDGEDGPDKPLDKVRNPSSGVKIVAVKSNGMAELFQIEFEGSQHRHYHKSPSPLPSMRTARSGDLDECSIEASISILAFTVRTPFRVL
ncbi:hypothetical protein PGT21_015485 [Puccinia graminis f. sp. tritici]|uniref:Uncharacterized protein n=1 Tax=Puccinia graminis f. sp. tritici TaxID=56615 RepID=A0A5B0NH78_PUCGR|nr:hypothetical protein PGT21_015485 [Puccinia graminis f. sp. tritici]KAA1087966.1 hypothetical protein PGTUg99_011103 [Puccinia graminis f. sp. tritici]